MKKRTEEENKRFLDEHYIKATGHKVPRPVQSFEESGLPQYLIDVLESDPKF